MVCLDFEVHLGKVYINLYLFLFIFAGCQTPIKAIERDTDFIAILENQNGTPHMRPVFAFKKGVWHRISNDEKNNFPSYWNIQYDGHVLGQVNVKINDNSVSEDSSLQKMEQNLSPKFLIEKNRDKFENWSGVPKYRPLLATRGKRKIASTGIVEGKIPQKIKGSVLKEFRKIVPSFVLCGSQESNKVLNKKKKYDDRDLKLDTVIKIGKENYLVGVILDKKLNLCDGPPESMWFVHWFHIQNGRDINFLGSGMYPVDKIDSESLLTPWVFSVSGYNQDGYILFFDNFQKSVSINWKYH